MMTDEQATTLHGFWINQPESPERELMLCLTERVVAGTLNAKHSSGEVEMNFNPTLNEYDPVGDGYDANDPKGWLL